MSAQEEIATVCPKCGSNLWFTNAVDACGLYWVGCRNLRCRWCEVYEIGEKMEAQP